MFFKIRVFLWSIAAELEYFLYPWTEETPPKEITKKYNLPIEIDYDKNFYYDWIKSHEEKISRLQQEMIWTQKEIHKLNLELKTHD